MLSMNYKLTAFLLAYLLCTPIIAQEKQLPSKPAIQHGITYKHVNNITQYWLSEKLDGIRGYWNGKHLVTRQGNIIHSPQWFTLHWPKNTMDGELWIARDQFQATLSCIRKVTIDEHCWQQVRFMIFDLPQHAGTFTERVRAMKNIIANTKSMSLAMIPQFKLESMQQVEELLNKVIANKGEGLMLHYENARYKVGRSANIMKLKKHQDAEATVIAHISGKGKYQNMLGAVKVKTAEGIIFKIGSGFSDNERANPPAIGTIITYKYNGKTKAGIPRFARFFRIRESKS